MPRFVAGALAGGLQRPLVRVVKALPERRP
jgi:hypothetical protein